VSASLPEADCDATALSALLSFSANVTTKYEEANAVTGREMQIKRTTAIAATRRRTQLASQIRIMILHLEECASGQTAVLTTSPVAALSVRATVQ
jgi:hypothetical protein